MAADPSTLDIVEAGHQLRAKALTSEALTEACLANITARNDELRAFITVTAESARAAARLADRELGSGHDRGPLHGIPIALKDLIDQAGVPTTAASHVRPLTPASSDAIVTARLKAAGAVLVGKTNLHEFALGTTSEDSAFGAVRNPLDTSRSAGGSSGGSAAAIVAGMALGAIGTDTGGSIRIPSAACGLVGLKPGFGEVPVDGVVPLSTTLDHVGPLARTVADAAAIHGVLARVYAARAAAAADCDGSGWVDCRATSRNCCSPKCAAPTSPRLTRLARRAPRSDRCRCRMPPTPRPSTCTSACRRAPRITRRRSSDAPNAMRRMCGCASRWAATSWPRTTCARRPRAWCSRPRSKPRSPTSTRWCCRRWPSWLRHLGAESVDVGDRREALRPVMLRLTQPFNLSRHPAVALPCGKGAGLPVSLQVVGKHARTGALLDLCSALAPLVAAAG